MNGLHLVAQFLLTSLFLLDGVSRILAVRRPQELSPAGPHSSSGPWFASIRLRSDLAATVGAAEIALALLLWVPLSLWQAAALPLLASAMLALLAIAASIYHMRRKEPAAPNIALFLLALFVILGYLPR